MQDQMRRQRRVTKSLAISCFFTLLLLVIPQSIAGTINILWIEGPLAVEIPLYGWMLANLNPFLNLFIYLFRQKDIKIGMMALFRFVTFLSKGLRTWSWSWRWG